jgi:hypothetical protein
VSSRYPEAMLKNSKEPEAPHRPAYDRMTDEERRALLVTALRLRASPEGSVGPTIGMILDEVDRVDDLIRRHADPKLRDVAYTAIEAALRSAVERFDLVDPAARLRALGLRESIVPTLGTSSQLCRSCKHRSHGDEPCGIEVHEGYSTCACERTTRDPVLGFELIQSDEISNIDIRRGILFRRDQEGLYREISIFDHPGALHDGQILVTCEGDVFVLSRTSTVPCDGKFVLPAFHGDGARWLRAAIDGGPPVLPDHFYRGREPIGAYACVDGGMIAPGATKQIQILAFESFRLTHLAISNEMFRVHRVEIQGGAPLVIGPASGALFVARFDTESGRPVTRGGRLPRGEILDPGLPLLITVENTAGCTLPILCAAIGDVP